MKYYELMAIVHPNIEEVGLKKINEEIKGLVVKRGGEVVYAEDMGKRKLAYPVEKQRFGTYLLIQFTGDGAGNARLLLDLEHNDNVLAQMVVKIREQDVREEQEEVEVESTTKAATVAATSPPESASEPETAPVDADQLEQDDSSGDDETETSTDEAAEEPEAVADEGEAEASEPEVEAEGTDELEAPEKSEVAEEN